jgi:putative transposase
MGGAPRGRARARSAQPRGERGRFRIDDRLRVRLAYWRGNAAALHRELLAEQKAGGPVAPSLETVQRVSMSEVLCTDVRGPLHSWA